MVVFRKGADPDALDRAAGQLTVYAGECRAARSTVDGAVSTLRSSWGGGDFEAFSGAWRSAAPSIDALERSLSQLGAKLRENAARQRDSSGPHGGGGGSGFSATPASFGPTPSPSPGPAPVPPPGAPTEEQGPATTGAGGPVDGYDFGDPKKPTIAWDDDFEYNSKDAGLGDHLAKAKWMAMLSGGRVFKAGLDDATSFYAHYWDNNGEAARFDYEEAYREDSGVRTSVNHEIGTTANAVDAMVRNGNTSFSTTGAPHPNSTPADTENWQKTIGQYQQWSSADVSVQDGVVTMKVTVHAEDRYNFNQGQFDIETGEPDNANGRFTEIGWAKPFDSSGDVTRTITWPVGDPPTDPDVGTADESRNPGREDRADERGNPRSGRAGSDRSTGPVSLP